MQKLFIALTLFALPTFAAEPPPFFKMLSGCFQVTYRYVEEGKVVYPNYYESGYEWIALQSATADSAELRHYGIFSENGKPMVIKHWGQSWKLEQGNTWKLSVLSPSDTVRYTCSSDIEISPISSKMIFQRRCAANGTPKPRRDMHRKDYETLDRVHIWNMTNTGWQDVQKNVKRAKDGSKVADEVGWNEYKRVDPTFCKDAMN